MDWKQFKENIESKGVTDDMSLGDDIVCFSLDNIHVSIHKEQYVTFVCIH